MKCFAFVNVHQEVNKEVEGMILLGHHPKFQGNVLQTQQH